MSFYCLDGRLCPMLPLDELDPATGHPLRAVYAYKGTEGGSLEWRVTNSLARVSDDENEPVPHGAVLYVEVYDDGDTNLQEVLNRLLAAKDRQAASGPQPGPNVEVTDEGFDPADTNQDGTVTKQERKQYERNK